MLDKMLLLVPSATNWAGDNGLSALNFFKQQHMQSVASQIALCDHCLSQANPSVCCCLSLPGILRSHSLCLHSKDIAALTATSRTFLSTTMLRDRAQCSSGDKCMLLRSLAPSARANYQLVSLRF
jgi:hypothetical protein